MGCITMTMTTKTSGRRKNAANTSANGAAWAQPGGVVGQPVKTKFGYHLILVRSRGVLGFDDVKSQIAAQVTRNPQQLQTRSRSWKFKRLQRRRAQTEGRIGILKNVFLGQPLRSKGFEHRELTVTWTVLVHNLWVVARLPQAEAGEARRLAA